MLNEFDGLHDWQKGCVENWLATDGPSLIMACPGAGKTRLGTRVIRIRKASQERQFAIVVCPTDAIKGQWAASGHFNDGLNITTRLRSDCCIPKAYDGACVTYAQLPGLVETIQTWRRNNSAKLFVVFDEVHHCSENATWGQAAKRVGEMCDRVMSLSGTPFRSDGSPIPFVTYNSDGFSIPQYSYTYAEAITDGVCRRVMFRLHDAHVERQWASDVSTEARRWTECEEDPQSWLRSGLKADGSAVRAIVADCWEALVKMRSAGDSTAACAFHCMSSGRDDIDALYIEKVARVVSDVTGVHPLVVHNRIAGASELIARFADSKSLRDQIIVAVDMFSEGVDIPRCRVGGYLNNVTTETRLRQMVGRHIRSERHKGSSQYAYVVMPDVPVFRDFASRVEQEAQVGLNAAKEKLQLQQGSGDLISVERNTVQTVSVTVEGASAVISGDVFNSGDESFGKAEAMSHEFPHFPTGDIARIIRKASAEKFSSCAVASPPMHRQCKEMRRQCSLLAKKISYLCPDDYPSPAEVYAEVNRRQRVPFNVGNAHDWIEENLGIAGLTARRDILAAMRAQYI